MRQLPSSPDDPVYQLFLRDVKKAPTPDVGVARFRLFTEADFWAFVKFATSFGKYVIDEPGHKHKGKLWVDEPYVFDLCRTVQEDAEERHDDVWYNQPRFHFKTQLITKMLTIWEMLREPTLTFALLTYKVDQIGESIAIDMKNELERNEVLHKHWPDRLTRDTRLYEFWTATAFSILRPTGIREPSFSIHSLRKQPTSGHYRRILVDDPEVAETVRSQGEIAQTVSDLRDITAIESTDTLTRHIGTVWDADGPQMRLWREKYYSRRNKPFSAIGEDGEPVLHSREFLKEWRRKLGSYKFSCQLLGVPTAKGDQFFNPRWISDFEYRKSPREERKGKTVHIIIDPATGKEGGDYTVFRVIGLGADKIRYVLDIHRERASLVEAINLLLGERLDEEPFFRRGLAQIWEPEVVWVEAYGGFEVWYQALKDAMEARSYRAFRLKKLPQVKRKKEQRIEVLQPYYEQGKIRYPELGFGHGSVRPKDTRDVKQQFLEDEYVLWTADGDGSLHDDMLDSEAWHVQPETVKLFRYPEIEEALGRAEVFESTRMKRPQVSPWVA